MNKYAKIIEYPERDTQIVVRKSIEHGEEEGEFYYTLLIDSYKSYPEFLAEPLVTLKYEKEEERDENFNSPKLKEKVKAMMDIAFKEIETLTKLSNNTDIN